MQVGWVKIEFIDWWRSHWLRRFTAENLCPSVMLVCAHDVVLAVEYSVINHAVCIRSWLIKVAVQLTLTGLIMWKSVDDTHS